MRESAFIFAEKIFKLLCVLKNEGEMKENKKYIAAMYSLVCSLTSFRFVMNDSDEKRENFPCNTETLTC